MNLRDVITANDFDRFLETRPCVLGPCGKCAYCGRPFDASRVCAARVSFAFALSMTPAPPPAVAAESALREQFDNLAIPSDVAERFFADAYQVVQIDVLDDGSRVIRA